MATGYRITSPITRSYNCFAWAAGEDDRWWNPLEPENRAGAFIGSLWAVGDRPARVFSETLYSALIDGANLAEATRKAREKAMGDGDATWLAYVVYGHPYLKVTLQKGK